MSILITGDRVFLHEFNLSDVNEKYVQWMNDPAVNQYTESRFSRSSIASLSKYVQEKIQDKNSYMFAIFLNENRLHIGNIKLGPVNRVHRRADIGIIIGDKEHWGQGYAKEAIKLLSDYAFKNIELNKVTAGCYAPNIGSLNAFLGCGFEIEGTRKNHSLFDGRYVDLILLGLLNNDKTKKVVQ